MKILLGGIVALVFGVIGLIIWFFDFLMILKGLIPVVLILGGALAIYLGIEDIKTSASSEEETPPSPTVEKEKKE
jgi:flagellar basal body-associated protein FliL